MLCLATLVIVVMVGLMTAFNVVVTRAFKDAYMEESSASVRARDPGMATLLGAPSLLSPSKWCAPSPHRGVTPLPPTLSSQGGAAMLTDGNGDVAGTAEAMVDLPLYAAPALALAELSKVKRLMISYERAGAPTVEMAAVTSVRRLTTTAVAFDLTCARSVVVADGLASLRDSGTRRMVKVAVLARP